MVTQNIDLKPVETNVGLKDKVYEALRSAIMSMDIYADQADTKLDERRLAQELGVSRTPIREALRQLESKGLVRMIPRRGAFVVRRTKREIMEMICVWGALESLAARLASVYASDSEIAELKRVFVNLNDPQQAMAEIDEYSEKNIRFHQSIIRLGKCELLTEMADGLFLHMHSIRVYVVKKRDCISESMVNHLNIIEAIEARDAVLAEKLVREHTEHLAENVNEYVNLED